MIARVLLVFLIVTGCKGDVADATPLRLTVMTFNAWGAGSNEGKSIDETVAVIRAVNPDIVGLQEARRESTSCTAFECPPSGAGAAADIAGVLGYFWYEQQQQNDALWANAILSRYPVSRVTGNDLGAVFEVGGRRVALFNIHLTDYPYQPYQLLGIPYDDAPFLHSAADAIAAAKKARGPALDLLMKDLATVDDVDAVFITGDFNEPSHRDWTERAAEAGRHPMRVRFPAAQRIEAAGFADAYRSFFPDEITHPGFTWAPAIPSDDKNDHHDRIDYVFVRARGARVERAVVVGKDATEADVVVSPWPSDHRAVVARFLIP